MNLLISREEIRKISEESRQFDDGLFPNWSDSDIWDGGFEEGVKFAEDKILDIILHSNKENSFDNFLLNSENYSQEDREIILQALNEFINDTIS